jgi:N-methylhydantoinase A
MSRGISKVSVERGYDPRKFSLICFGGGGPLHAVELAEELNIPEVIIPLSAGVTSAVGLLIADFRYDYSRTFFTKLSEVKIEAVNDHFQKMEEQALRDMEIGKINKEDVSFIRSIDMRYYGQGYELEVPVSNGYLNKDTLEEVKNSFNKIHIRLYGYSQFQDEIEIVYLRLAAIGKVPKPKFYKEIMAETDSSQAIKDKRKVFLDGDHVETSIYDRCLLKPNNTIKGPAIIEQFDSTILVKQGQSAVVDEYFNLKIQVS